MKRQPGRVAIARALVHEPRLVVCDEPTAALAGATANPMIPLGRPKPLHLRVDVDENEAWRVRPEARATAAVRGNANLKTPLTFVCFEPFVLPKKSLTGDSTERVDTRVLQVIYRIERHDLRLFIGQ